jgi:ribosomal protein S6--L-glutamate ligase
VHKEKIIIGKEEWCSLPTLGLRAIKARVDSGAKTSALHAFNIQRFEEDGITYVSFDIHPVQGNRKLLQKCRARVVDHRNVKSSSGDQEKRIVIKTPVRLGDEEWDIELTLTNRDSMGYRMLLGREAMVQKVLIDPESSFVLGELPPQLVESYYAKRKPSKAALNIVILASNPKLYSNKRIIEAGEQRGHHMRFISIKHCYMNINEHSCQVYYRGGEDLGDVDAVIPRIKPGLTFYGCALVRQFQSLGVHCLNDAAAISRARDKLRALQTMAANGIAMPVTGFADSPMDTNALINLVNGAPLVVKLLEGTQGRGVVLAETQKAAESVINAFKSLKANILVQEFVKEANGIDLRCFVIDNKVVGAMQRVAAEGEFRANLHLGGTPSPVKITVEERRMAIKSAKAMKLSVAGVDIIRSKSGPKVLEVNSSPGLEGIEEVTGRDIAGLMIESIEKTLITPKK